MAESKWWPRSGYEVAYVDRIWLVLVQGGEHQSAEPSLRVVARCHERDEAFRIRDALRATLDGAQS